MPIGGTAPKTDKMENGYIKLVKQFLPCKLILRGFWLPFRRWWSLSLLSDGCEKNCTDQCLKCYTYTVGIFMAEGCGLSGGRQSEQHAQGGKLVN